MFVYADNAATTSVSKTALNAMLPYLTENYGNPSSLYGFAQKVTEAVAQARATVPGCCQPPGDILHLRRQRGGQPGHHVCGQGGGAQGKETPDIHQV